MTTTATDHPFAEILTAGRKVVFSRTPTTAVWANITIAAGDTARRSTSSGEAATATSWSGAASGSGGRSAARPDRRAPAELVPLRCGRGTRLFDGVPNSYRLDLVSSAAPGSGIVELLYRRHR